MGRLAGLRLGERLKRISMLESSGGGDDGIMVLSRPFCVCSLLLLNGFERMDNNAICQKD